MEDFKWKTPVEVKRLQRHKQKQQAPKSQGVDIMAATEIYATNKRKNSFVDKRTNITSKRQIRSPIVYEEIESISTLIEKTKQREDVGVTSISIPKNHLKNDNKQKSTTSLTHLINSNEIDGEDNRQLPTKYVPVDWSLKTKLGILNPTAIQGNDLKISGASGITSFVRCIEVTTTTTGLDFSPGARFHQGTLYWQHPNIPWLALFPRNAKSNATCAFGEVEREALNKDWSESFQSLFQLLRVRHCPYFYCCANSFTVLFRAAGIGGRAEAHALAPTTSGLRAALKQENIDFIMPMKAADNANKSNPDIRNQTDNFSHSSESLTQDTGCNDVEDDFDEWLASMGVKAAKIKKIRSTHSRLKQSDECKEDYSDRSIDLFEGIECEALFNFLLNAKSTTASIPRLAGFPPTLLAPVALSGATLHNVEVNSGKIRLDNRDYHSLELKGVILPHILQYLCNLLCETKAMFSVSTASQNSSMSFSKAAHLMNEELTKENQISSGQVFGLWTNLSNT